MKSIFLIYIFMIYIESYNYFIYQMITIKYIKNINSLENNLMTFLLIFSGKWCIIYHG
jgi:hypothetical protein